MVEMRLIANSNLRGVLMELHDALVVYKNSGAISKTIYGVYGVYKITRSENEIIVIQTK